MATPTRSTPYLLALMLAALPSLARAADDGYADMPRLWGDVNGDGVKDYCRFVGTRASPEFSCRLMSASGTVLSEYGYTSQHGIDAGFSTLPQAMVDVNGDGRADYCRFVGTLASPTLACMLVDTTTSAFSTNQYGFKSPMAVDAGYATDRFWEDMNGDHRMDYCRLVGSQDFPWRACVLATPTGFSSENYTIYAPGMTPWDGHTPIPSGKSVSFFVPSLTRGLSNDVYRWVTVDSNGWLRATGADAKAAAQFGLVAYQRPAGESWGSGSYERFTLQYGGKYVTTDAMVPSNGKNARVSGIHLGATNAGLIADPLGADLFALSMDGSNVFADLCGAAPTDSRGSMSWSNKWFFGTWNNHEGATNPAAYLYSNGVPEMYVFIH